MASEATSVNLIEVGPREGFQFEGIGAPDKISAEEKAELVASLAHTGLRTIQVTSFVSPKAVPQMADAETVAELIPDVSGVTYTAIYLNDKGLKRAIATERFKIAGRVSLTASETFSKKNQRRDAEQDIEMQRQQIAIYHDNDIPVERGGMMAAFGCNYEGDIPLEKVLSLVATMHELTEEAGDSMSSLQLADTMGWADPEMIKRTIGAIRERWPALEISLHLHDTRGTGLANVYAGLEMGVRQFDTSVAGLGGCPFAGTIAGNVATEDVVFMCERMGIDTGVDLDALVRSAKLAERIVGHPAASRMPHVAAAT